MEQLAIDISECRHLDDIAAEPFTLWGGEGAAVRPLRHLDDGALRSAAVMLPEGWRGTLSAGARVTQVFVRSGALTLAGTRIGPLGLIVLGEGTEQEAEATTATEMLVVLDHECSAAGAPDGGLLVIEDAMALAPIEPVIEGKKLEGFFMRFLWVNPETGADTMLLHVPGGFRGGGPNFHPVNEEIFCLEGDIQPDETRPMRAGSYLLNPVRSVHGFDEVSHGGCVLLEWHDGPWALTYSPEGIVRPARS